MTTKGDAVFATGANAGARVAVGANGKLIVANSACTVGVAWDAAIVVSASNVGVGTTTASAAMHIQGAGQSTTCPRLASTCPGATLIITDSTGVVNSGGLIQMGGGACIFAGIKALLQNGNNQTNGDLAFVLNSDQNATCMTEAARFYTSNAAKKILGINNTSNANMTTGLTINQGAATDEALALQNTCVVHGVTSQADTSTFLDFKINNAGSGGAQINAFEGGANQNVLWLAAVGPAGDTTKSATANGAINLAGAQRSGNSVAAMAANANVVVIRSSWSSTGTTRFIFDADGDLLADAAITASAYDTHDDAALCRAISLHISQPDTIIRTQFDEWTSQYDKGFLKRAKLVFINDDGSKFVNYTQLARLHNSAIWQLENKIRRLSEFMEHLAQATGLDTKLLDDNGPPMDNPALD